MPRRTHKEILLSLIPKDGGTIGNSTLRKKLRWDDKKYWTLREELLAEGTISTGRGKGGSVYRREIEKKAERSKRSEE